jgi:hypothetical protein
MIAASLILLALHVSPFETYSYNDYTFTTLRADAERDSPDLAAYLLRSNRDGVTLYANSWEATA